MIRLMKYTFYQENRTKKRLCEFIKQAEQLSMGKKCKEFEEGFSKYQGRKYSVLFNSGSSANLALMQSLVNLRFLNKEDIVGVSGLTWATNVMPVVQMGLNPLPIDVSLKNLNVNLENIPKERKGLKAIFLTNLLGFCGDLDKIKKYCEDNKIILIEDNCESLGSVLGKTKFGNFGLASTFSFFVGHHLSTIEGGMVCTDNKELYNMLLMVRAHGWSRNLDEDSKNKLKEKHQVEDFYIPYTFYALGYNIRPTEITGFIGLEQLDYIEHICKVRNKNFKLYHRAAQRNEEIMNLDFSHISFESNFAYPLIFKNKKTMEKYKERFLGRVEIRPIVAGSISRQPVFNFEGDCPNADKIHERGFYIPNNPDLKVEEINDICELIQNAEVS